MTNHSGPPTPSRFWDYTLAVVYAAFAWLAVLYLVDVAGSQIFAAANGSVIEQGWEWVQLAGAVVALAGAVAPTRYLSAGKAAEALGSATLGIAHGCYAYTQLAARTGPIPAAGTPVPWHTVIAVSALSLIFLARALWVTWSRGRLLDRTKKQEAREHVAHVIDNERGR